MKKKILSGIISILFILFSLSLVSAAIINVPGDYPTIQAAINAANPGDTIVVEDGTYVEDLKIPAGKNNLELEPANSASIIRGVQNVPIASWPLAVPNIEILSDGVKIHGFTIEGPDRVADTYSSGMVIDGQNVEIYDNDFVTTAAETIDELAHAITTYSKTAIPTADVSGLNVHDNTFVCSGVYGCEAIYINPHTGSGAITIADNQFSGSVYVGISAESGNVNVASNTINSAIKGLYGIRFFDTSYVATYDNIVVSENTISNYQYGIRVGNGGAGTTTITADILSNSLTNNDVGIWGRNGNVITATGNKIAGNTVGVRNDDTTVIVNAENNWWGNITGPYHLTLNPSGLGNPVSDNVDFTPWSTLQLTLTSPESKAYDIKKILIDVSTTVIADKIEYSLDGGSFRKLCNDCNSYNDEKSFREGLHTLEVKATAGTEIDSETVNFFVDSTKPKIIKILPKDGEIIQGTTFYIKYTEQNLVSITLYWEEHDGDAYTAVPLEDCPQGVSKECSTNVDLSEYDGEIDFYFEIKDPANTVTSETRTITIDNTEPTVTITSPTEDIGIYGTKSIDLTVTVDETVKTLEYSLDGKAFSTLCNDCSSYSHKKTFSDGDHTIVVKATDYAGNFGEGTVDFSVDSKDPKAIKQYPLDKKYANGEFKIIYTEDNLVSITLKYKRDSESEWQSVTQPCEAGKRKECVFNIREDLTAYDNQYIYYYFIITNHIRSTSSKTYTEKVDVTDPVVTINSPDPTTYDTRRVPMDITVTEDVKLEYSLDGSNYRRICSRCDSYEHSKTFSDGTHTLLIRATDEAENTGQDSVSFTV